MSDGPVSPPPSGMPGVPASLVDRAKNILTSPSTEWPRIDAETTSIGKLITGYGVILALLAPIAMLVGMLLFAGGGFFGAAGFLIKVLIVTYLISLGTVLLLGLAIDLLTTSLGGVRNSVQAMKLAVYSGTAFWVAALILILPTMWWLWLFLGVGYGAYLLWLGLPVLMKVPADKAPVFAGAAIGIWVVTFLILQQVGWRIIFAGMFYGYM